MNERIRAFELALQATERRRSGAAAPYAVCRACRSPLITTIAFRGFEFYCLECGRHYGFVAPEAAEPTPELAERYAALKAEWDKHAATRLLVEHGWYRWCSQCRPGGEYHIAHANAEELAAHEAALAWLAERAASSPTRPPT